MSNGVRRSNPVITRTVREDCVELSKVLRKADREEISHSSGLEPQDALLYSFAVSDRCYTVRLDDEIVMIFGVGGEPGQWGCPWMMASDLLLQIRRDFVRDCRSVVQAMLEQYPHLENHVWAGNKIHIYWLEWLGFVIEPPRPYGIDGEPFHRFYMKR